MPEKRGPGRPIKDTGMKWFKHMAGSLDSSFICELIDEYGPSGYLVYFGCMEILADKFDVECPGKVTLSWAYLRRKLHLKSVTIRNVLTFCQEKDRINSVSEGKHVTLNCPKFAALCDEYTNKKLRTKSGLTPEKVRVEGEEEGDKETDKGLPPKPPTGGDPALKIEPPEQPPCPQQDIIALYHEILPMMKPVNLWNDRSQKKLRARWRESPERQSLEWWEKFFRWVARSDFLCGKKTDFVADLDWMLGPVNWQKIANQKYHGGTERAAKIAAFGEKGADSYDVIQKWLKGGKDGK